MIGTGGPVVVDGGLATELEAQRSRPIRSAVVGAAAADRPGRHRGGPPRLFPGRGAGRDDRQLPGIDRGLRRRRDRAGRGASADRTERRAREPGAGTLSRRRPATTGALLVAGSVGPYGAMLADGSEYRGDYDPGAAALTDFHRPRIEALVEAGADLLAFETIPTIREAEVLVGLLDDVATPAWLSYSCRDGRIDIGRRADRGRRRRRRPPADRRGRRQLHRPAAPPGPPRRGTDRDGPAAHRLSERRRAMGPGEPALARRRRRWLRPRRGRVMGRAGRHLARRLLRDRTGRHRRPGRAGPSGLNTKTRMRRLAHPRCVSEGEGQTASVVRREKSRIAARMSISMRVHPMSATIAATSRTEP